MITSPKWILPDVLSWRLRRSRYKIWTLSPLSVICQFLTSQLKIKGPIKQSQHLSQHSHNICCEPIDVETVWPDPSKQIKVVRCCVMLIVMSLNSFKLCLTTSSQHLFCSWNVVRLLWPFDRAWSQLTMSQQIKCCENVVTVWSGLLTYLVVQCYLGTSWKERKHICSCLFASHDSSFKSQWSTFCTSLEI